MDSDLWISRLVAAKRNYQISQLDRFAMEDCEVEEEIRSDFICPYCYEYHDVTSVCPHLEDEQSIESKISRRRRLRRVPIPNSSHTLSLLGRDLREAHLQVLLGTGGYQSSNTTTSTAVTDSLLSSLVLNFPASKVEELSKSTISAVEDFSRKKTRHLQTWKSSVDPSLSYEEREQKQKQDTVKATYVQDLLLTTLFRD